MLKRHRVIAALSATAMLGGSALALAPAASAKPTSLGDILLADTKKDGSPSYDRNKADFDILTAAVLTVLADDPHSAVSVLTDPSVKLTAFIPNDAAFKKTAKALGLKAVKEAKVANRLVAVLGVNKVEKVLLYHVVPGMKITSKMAAASDGARLETALGKKIGVNVRDSGKIFLRDANRKVANPQIIAVDINKDKDNKQIAHVINSVLLPF